MASQAGRVELDRSAQLADVANGIWAQLRRSLLPKLQLLARSEMRMVKFA